LIFRLGSSLILRLTCPPKNESSFILDWKLRKEGFGMEHYVTAHSVRRRNALVNLDGIEDRGGIKYYIIIPMMMAATMIKVMSGAFGKHKEPVTATATSTSKKGR
jgi:hypothetical protein